MLTERRATQQPGWIGSGVSSAKVSHSANREKSDAATGLDRLRGVIVSSAKVSHSANREKSDAATGLDRLRGVIVFSAKVSYRIIGNSSMEKLAKSKLTFATSLEPVPRSCS